MLANSTTYDGGAIYVSNLSRNCGIAGDTFMLNTAVSGGGAMYVTVFSGATVQKSLFFGNMAGLNGGGVHVTAASHFISSGNWYSLNVSNASLGRSSGGGALDERESRIDASADVIVGNAAASDGGGVHAFGAETGSGNVIWQATPICLNMSRCFVGANVCGGYGGGLGYWEQTVDPATGGPRTWQETYIAVNSCVTANNSAGLVIGPGAGYAPAAVVPGPSNGLWVSGIHNRVVTPNFVAHNAWIVTADALAWPSSGIEGIITGYMNRVNFWAALPATPLVAQNHLLEPSTGFSIEDSTIAFTNGTDVLVNPADVCVDNCAYPGPKP